MNERMNVLNKRNIDLRKGNCFCRGYSNKRKGENKQKKPWICPPRFQSAPG